MKPHRLSTTAGGEDANIFLARIKYRLLDYDAERDMYAYHLRHRLRDSQISLHHLARRLNENNDRMEEIAFGTGLIPDATMRQRIANELFSMLHSQLRKAKRPSHR